MLLDRDLDGGELLIEVGGVVAFALELDFLETWPNNTSRFCASHRRTAIILGSGQNGRKNHSH